MATSREYIDWVCERLAPYGEVRPRAMFGEYIVSLNGKNVVTVCDNCVFVKELPALAETFRDAERGFPYDGAKEHYILDMDDRALLDEVVPLLEVHMPLPKPRPLHLGTRRGAGGLSRRRAGGGGQNGHLHRTDQPRGAPRAAARAGQALHAQARPQRLLRPEEGLS